ALNWLMPLAITGIIIFFLEKKSKKSDRKTEAIIFAIFLLIGLVIIWDYGKTPYKIERYLFNLILPAVFLSSITLCKYIKEDKKVKKKIIAGLFIVFLLTTFALATKSYERRNLTELYANTAKKITALGLESCSIRTPHWIPLYYYTENAYYLYNLDEAMTQNEAALIFKGHPTLNDNYNISDLDKYKKVYEDEEILIISGENYKPTTCAERFGWDVPGVAKPCSTISEKITPSNPDSFINRACLKINKR
ncbi:MAG: hypothetical protein KC506_02580, partial [Nanoarchaeota archaeon]|nr:hypothetical protein [Nanoarchaeota archaeon]